MPAYLAELVVRERQSGRDTLLGALTAAGDLTEREVVETLALLLVAAV